MLESTEPSEKNYQVLAKLFHQGFSLALDDFIYSEAWDKFFPLIKLIKIDIIETPLSSIEHLLPYFRQYRIKLLAEKVETYEDFVEAKALGFDYYQGYFFVNLKFLLELK